MSLLQEIIEGASDDKMSTATLLRKCMVLGSKLGSQSMEHWLDWELNSYPETVEVPEYRHLSMLIKVDMIDLGKRANGYAVPPEFLDANSKKFTEHEYRASIAEIEEYLSENKGNLEFKVGNLVREPLSKPGSGCG